MSNNENYQFIYNDAKEIIGYVCKCGAIQKRPAYIFQHNSTPIMIACSGCRKEIYIENGEIRENN